MTAAPTRRFVLRAGLGGGVGLTAALAGCAPGGPDAGSGPSAGPGASTAPSESPGPGARTLLVYFSRAGENYHYGDRRFLDTGNTEVLARMIGDRVACDVFRIEEADPYPESYDATVARNREEQNADARPAIADALPDAGPYDTVLLGSPVWNSRAPMILSTFVEGVDLAGKAVLPFVTYAVSGMSGVDDDYREALPDSDVGAGLAVLGETVAQAGPQLDGWLGDAGLLTWNSPRPT